MTKINLIILQYYLIFLKLNFIKSDSNCSCKLTDLVDLEQLDTNLKRIRIEYPNGLDKYSDNQLSYSSVVQCKSVALYENKKCRTCLLNEWSELSNCAINRCDKDWLLGQPILYTFSSKLVPQDQKLFIPGHVIAIFKYPTEKLCKICQSDGEWSKLADPTLCRELTVINQSISCKYDDLRNLEYKELEYVRIRIETFDGLNKISVRSIKENKLNHGSIVVYQRYLSLLATYNRVQESTKSYYPSYPFTKRFCRYCENGVWSDIESCVSLKCDKDLLTGNPQLILTQSKIKPSENQALFDPYSVIAVYYFGSDKFCKQCHENGEWSKYSLNELCKLNQPEHSATKDQWSSRNKDLEELYKKEATCSMQSLNKIENEFSNFSRIFFISSDRRRVLNPHKDAKIPSRTLSVYQMRNKNYCSICINGIWSTISDKCSTDSSLYFCRRDELKQSGKFHLDDSNLASDTQDLFEQGSVMVVYEISDTTRLCKICEFSLPQDRAQWSKYAEARLCNPEKAFYKHFNQNQKLINPNVSCSLKDLLLIENKDYTRENVQTWDAKSFVTGEIVQEYSMAVYESNSADLKESSLKWCRKCRNGDWDENYFPCPIEFSIKKCDPLKIRGVNYFVHLSDGSRLDDEDMNNLMFPGKVMAVYEFGIQKYCKLCNEDGTWSSYPQYQLCSSVNWPL